MALVLGCSAADPVDENRVSPVSKRQEARPKLMDLTEPPNLLGLAKGEVVPPNPDEAQELLEQEGAEWFYGRGLGATLLNVGAIIIFPPYGLYLLFNAGMKMAGEEPVYISDALPGEARERVAAVYDEVVGVPGKITSTLANEEFRE